MFSPEVKWLGSQQRRRAHLYAASHSELSSRTCDEEPQSRWAGTHAIRERQGSRAALRLFHARQRRQDFHFEPAVYASGRNSTIHPLTASAASAPEISALARNPITIFGCGCSGRLPGSQAARAQTPSTTPNNRGAHSLTGPDQQAGPAPARISKFPNASTSATCPGATSAVESSSTTSAGPTMRAPPPRRLRS